MSSKGSGHVVRGGGPGHTFEDVGAVLCINSMQEAGAEFWWALVPDHEVLNEHGPDNVYITMEVHGWNPELFVWQDPPATVQGALADHATVSMDDQGRCQISIDAQAPSGEFDFTLHITVDEEDIDLDPEIDVGMEGPH